MANATMQIRFPKGLAKALTFSYDDAVIEDERLVKIMLQHGLKGTFNVNSGSYSPEGYERPTGEWRHCRMSLTEATRLYQNSGMEIAIHSYTHPHLESLPIAQVSYEIVRDRAMLEEQFGRIVRGGAYPFGTYNDETVQAPFFHYTDEAGVIHEVWFEDARSIGSRLELVAEYGFRGCLYWNLSRRNVQNLLMINLLCDVPE